MQTMDIEEIIDRGLSDEASLSETERLVYSVAYLESVSDMEGWDQFFTHSMGLYPALTKLLKLSGDFQSLSVVKNYKEHFKKNGVKFESKDIDRFLTNISNEYLDSCPDWREQFSDLSEQRWDLISRYFFSIGIKLQC